MKNPVCITEPDLERLQETLRAHGTRPGSGPYVAALREELQRAEVVATRAVQDDVVTMHSRFELTDLDSGVAETHTLVFPDEAGSGGESLSVLAPVGRAVLGLRAGEEFELKVPLGVRRLRVGKVLYQPEAAGDEA